MNFLKPFLTLTPDFNGQFYSMTARIFAPNGCYLAAGTFAGWPKGMVGVPEAQPMQLYVQNQGVFCTQAIKRLDFHHSGLACAGKSHMVAMTILEGNTLGQSTAVVPYFDPKELLNRLEVSSKTSTSSNAFVDSVNASVDCRPSSNPDLFVAISVTAPTLEYTFSVEGLGPFGITGRTLLLRLHAKKPKIGPEVLTPKVVRFQEELEQCNQFDSVAMEFEGKLYFDTIEFLN